MPSRLSTKVYLMVRADGLRKIGCSSTPQARLYALSHLHKMPYEIEQVWDLPEIALAVEQLIHNRILHGQSARGEGAPGEHYRMSRQVAVGTIEMAIKAQRAGYVDPPVYDHPLPLEAVLSAKEFLARSTGRPLVSVENAFRKVPYRLTSPMPDFRWCPFGKVAPFTGVPHLVARPYAELLEVAS